MKSSILLVFLMTVFGISPSFAAQDYMVQAKNTPDLKVVFATVESVDQVPARARIGGTIVGLNVKEGDVVTAGQEIAIVGDEKLALQIQALDAQVSGLTAQSVKADADFRRVQSLIGSGSVSKSEVDAAKAAASSRANDLKSVKSQRELVEQQVTEGKILSPSKGRVLQVPFTTGSVVMAGENIATIAAESYILRLQLPERHARFMKMGDKIILNGNEMGNQSYKEGTITLVYPEIENGRVMADAHVDGLENYFIGERVRAWISTSDRMTIGVPENYLVTKSGIDYVQLKSTDGQILDVPVQRGHSFNQDGIKMVDILSGLHDGDIVIAP